MKRPEPTLFEVDGFPTNITRYREDEFCLDTIGPVIFGEYQFEIYAELEGLPRALLYSSREHLPYFETHKVAEQVGFFVLTRLRTMAYKFENKEKYWELLRAIPDEIRKYLRVAHKK